jgi:hypothetical protein
MCLVKYGIAVIATVVVAAIASATAGAAQQPVSLAGEWFAAGADGTTSQFTGVCNPSGTSEFQFRVTGIASGPLGGTFAETGTFTLVSGSEGTSLVSFHSVFVVTSALGFAFGTRSASADQAASADVFCGEVAWRQPYGVLLRLTVGYTARVVSRKGVGQSSGVGVVDYGDVGSRTVPTGMAPFQFLASMPT